MVETIRAFHGTGRLDYVLEDGALLASFNRDRDDNRFFKVQYEDYQRIVNDTAEVVRKALREGWLPWKDVDGAELKSPDEVLTDLASHRSNDFPFVNIPKGPIEYDELKRGLFLYFSDRFQGAVGYGTLPRRIQPFPGVLEFDLPKGIIRPDVHPPEQAITYLVLGRVGLEHLRKIYTGKEDIKEVGGLLGAQGLENIPVEAFR